MINVEVGATSNAPTTSELIIVLFVILIILLIIIWLIKRYDKNLQKE